VQSAPEALYSGAGLAIWHMVFGEGSGSTISLGSLSHNLSFSQFKLAIKFSPTGPRPRADNLALNNIGYSSLAVNNQTKNENNQ